MKTGTFMDIVGTNYDDIKNIFSSRNNIGKKFNEDCFNEAFIKCAAKFGNSIISYEDVIKYFWIAYINTYKNEYVSESKLCLCEDFTDFDNDLEYVEYDNTSNEIYDNIMNAISKAFSHEDMVLYNLYKCHKWKKDDLLKAGYDCTNLETRIKNIHGFVKEYCKKNYKANYKKKSR